MKLKKMVLISVLVASLVTMVLPVNAAETVSGSVLSTTDQQTDEMSITTDLTETQQGMNAGTELLQPDQSPTDDPPLLNGTEQPLENSYPIVPQEQRVATAGSASPTDPDVSQLVLMMNSNKMYQDGKQYLAPHPMTVKDGVSYISIRAIVERTGLKLSFDNKTKETIIRRGGDELRFKLNSKSYKVNGTVKQMKGPSYSSQDVFMVPLTSITQALGIPYTVNQQEKKVILSLSSKPVASFRIGNPEIFAGETLVQYIPSAFSPKGLPIIEEQWEGREDIFMSPGSFVVSYRVKDSSGQWSDTFWLTVRVSKPHSPPVASFTTNKDTYKMGELVTYTDYSTDENNAIVKREWYNNELAFFLPGPKTIRLVVENKYGLSSTYEKTIMISDETLYTRDDFYKIYTPVGWKYSFDGTKIPAWDKVPYQYDTEPVTLIRSNSPETVYSEGVVYRDSAIGSTRFMLHHVNATRKNVRMYVIATNRNSETARLTQTNLGMGGPTKYATASGKMSVQRYFESMQYGNKYKDIWIAPGQSKVILSELSSTVMRQGDVISLFADLYSDRTLQYHVIMIDSSRDPIKALPNLPALAPDNHSRGTFYDATKNIHYGELIGLTPSRLLIGDNSQDPYLIGTDGMTKAYQVNAGNFGVLYRIKLYRVAPQTLITFNPRGGQYDGVIMVNGYVVQVPETSGLRAPHESGVLHRTGDREETVELVFTAAPGSSLSVNLLFQPLPEIKH
ncbi:copper amine oxidase N-terminal domain-containing protein [Paenibacillus fonticola]|uniref:copper amine oxidase N-terminal domain-containing protein n=1 Tax=Paenibacillus fonticola TaxID=379896 RepID=UPI0003770348|nr:copper amine oxidase N-terminal domain-containing protein [Paenibacillus fonticola]